MAGDYLMIHEVGNVCRALTLAGLRKNPYPMVSQKQEQRWTHAPRGQILAYVRSKYGAPLAAVAETFPLFTLH
jgi:hypothetical protein